MILAAWGSLAMTAAADAVRQARMAQETLRAWVALASAIDAAPFPPDLALLCLSPPLAPVQRGWAVGLAERAEVRWRHVGDGIVLAEADAISSGGVRARALLWFRPALVAREDGMVRCPGTQLHPLPSSGVVSRPGE